MKKQHFLVLMALIVSSMDALAINSYDATSESPLYMDYIVSGDRIYSDVYATFSDYKVKGKDGNCMPEKVFSSYDPKTRLARLDSVLDVKSGTIYCDVDVTVNDIKSTGDSTPVEIYTNSYDPVTNIVNVDSVMSGRQIFSGYGVTFSKYTESAPLEFFNSYDSATNVATLHTAVNLGTGAVLNNDFLVNDIKVATPGATTPVSTTKTTVLVYIVGTDLEENQSSGSLNIAEMTGVGSNDNMNVIVQTGGATKAGPANKKLPVDWTRVQRWKVGQWDPVKLDDLSKALTPIADLGADGQVAGDGSGRKLDMGNSDELQRFIQWGVTAYPADKYVLALGSHSGGPNGKFGPDSITNSSMSFPSIVAAIQSSPKPFELVVFDSCLMGSAEVAAGLALRAKYMVASEDYQAGAGFDYITLLQQIVKNPGATGNVIGKALVGSYYLKAVQKDSGGNINVYARPTAETTSSAIDLSKMSDLKAATDEFANNLKKYTSTGSANANVASWLKVAKARVDALDFATLAIIAANGLDSDLVDMQRFVENIKAGFASDDIALTAASDRLISAIKSAVIYNKASLSDRPATGLSVYFPSVLGSYNKSYDNNTTNNNTRFFSESYTNPDNGLLAGYNDFYVKNKKDIANSVGDVRLDAGVLSATVTNPVQNAMAAIGRDTCSLIDPVDQKTTITLSCYLSFADISVPATVGGSVSFDKNNKAAWPLLNNMPAVLIKNSPTKGNGRYGDYLIPVALDDGRVNRDGFLRVSYYSDNNSYAVDGFIGYASNPSNPSIPAKGNTITLRYPSSATTASGFFLYRSADQSFKIGDNGLTVSFGAVAGNIFTFVTTDYAGAINKATDISYK